MATVRRVKQEARLRRCATADAEGHGPHKPAPPPKPLSSYSPPPYRMPPYPALYGDTAIPGAAAATTTTALHTHSSKFPIEREVILSSVDKNSKIPILHEYKKQRPKSASSATIAPEGPNKQVAWMENKKTTITTAHPMQVVQDGGRGPKPQLEYRSQFHGPDTQYLYNGYHGAVSTGAIPRTWRTDGDQTTTGRSPASLPQTDPDGMKQEDRKTEDDDADKNKAFPARTYNTIKDMISSRFGSGKATKEGESTLNNASGSVIHKDDRPQNGIYIVMRQPPESSNYGTPNTILAKVQSRRGSQSRLDEDDDEGGFLTGGGSGAKTLRSSNRSGGGQQQSSSQSSDYEKATQRSTGQSSSNADSGRGSTIYSGAHQAAQASEHLNTSTESSDSPQTTGRDVLYSMPTANDTEWVDVVETELRQILDPELHGLGRAGANSTLSESISSLTPPLPPLSPGGGSSPSVSPQNSTRYKHGSRKAPPGGSGGGKSRNVILPGSRGGWNSRQSAPEKHRQSSKKNEPFMSSKTPLSASVFGLDTTDLTSTTTGLDSVLDGNTENNSSDDDLSTTIDTTDAHAIRKQLEGLENMYSEVLKLLGVKKYSGRYQPSDPRINKRRLYGSMSSLPSSVSSRPIRDRRKQDERKKVKDIKGINKRFQRLESHVVTLARSVAHLSSEMRTQHLMIQEMENIRGEISALRSQTLAVRSQSMPRGLNNVLPPGERDSLTNPTRVKKLTKFFGDEPPLLRLFLKKLGYEKYAGIFEQERVGMVELPYLTEERLQKMGIPLGPRLRILQEAQISVCRDKIYVV